MFGKPKLFSSPSDAQANEKLALYVYEYLVYCGAQKAAQIFLQEVGLEKHLVSNEAPGFLFSWWSIFWDLYCAAPERRDVFKHSSDARAFYDFGLAGPGFIPSTLQPSSMGMHYIQGRNGLPPPLVQHQQYMSPPRQAYPSGVSRSNDVKLSGLVPIGNDQQLEAFLSSSAPPFRQISSQNIPTLPIASTPSVTLRHQPRPPMVARGSVPTLTNGNSGVGGGPMNPSSVPSFSGSPPNGLEFHTQQQQFGRPSTFQQQRSLPHKMSPCPSNGIQPSHWSSGLGQPVDFMSTSQPLPNKLSPDPNGGGMIFDPSMMDQMGPAPPQPQGLNVGPAGDTFTFFDQADGLPSTSIDDSVQSQQRQQQTSSQISQLLSPSPNQRSDPNPQSVSTKSVGNIEDALLPDLDLLGGNEVDPGDGSNQPSGQLFANDQMKGETGSTMLFPNSDDLQAVQNIVDAMQGSETDSGDFHKQQQRSFCSEANALFLQE